MRNPYTYRFMAESIAILSMPSYDYFMTESDWFSVKHFFPSDHEVFDLWCGETKFTPYMTAINRNWSALDNDRESPAERVLPHTSSQGLSVVHPLTLACLILCGIAGHCFKPSHKTMNRDNCIKLHGLFSQVHCILMGLMVGRIKLWLSVLHSICCGHGHGSRSFYN